ncbi:OmpA family protein [Ideonella sp. 4Y16]|uniref:OmpA family protein n=1 Tax=Ideonella alba TaxID=2824118 RepID=A0A940YFN2_9BURK|nr:OmpA family protein [Ideonella alba]MBQ0931632.1 OmpA family protein [Ideonella alba]MBQ0944066.1 OmpA family protein [Ideonella alba]
MLDDIDDGARVGVWTTIGIIALLLFGLIGGLGIRQLHKSAAAQAPAPAVAADEALIDGPLTGELAGTLFFAVGSAELPAEAAAEITKAQAAATAAAGKKLVLSGFHDASGDPAKNAELAKNRAKAVRAALVAAGVDAARIGLRKPESTTGDGTADQARRVEIRLVD